MDRISSLVLSIKDSPFVPIKLYRDLPRTRELLSDQAVLSNAFSLSPLWTQEPAGLGRENRKGPPRRAFELFVFNLFTEAYR